MSTMEVREAHSDLLDELIEHLETSERSFYQRSARWNYRAWHVTAGISFFSSVLTAMVAAFAACDGPITPIRGALVVIPIVGATATGLLHLYKYREKEALRENGRIENEDLIGYAKSLRASATCEEHFRTAFDAVRERHKHLEIAQHREDASFRATDCPTVVA